jgi:hypothetical protein
MHHAPVPKLLPTFIRRSTEFMRVILKSYNAGKHVRRYTPSNVPARTFFPQLHRPPAAKLSDLAPPLPRISLWYVLYVRESVSLRVT